MAGRLRLRPATFGVVAGALLMNLTIARAADPEPLGELLGAPGSPVEPSPTVSPASGRSRQIEEIVVTARKREERAQDVPVVVTTLGDAVERYDIVDITEVAEMTPQLIATEASSGAGGTISLRGISTSSTSSGFEQAVAINVDGVHYSNANILAQGFFDLGRIEILKGPQALFFGKNSPAGVISLSSADPGPDREWIGRLGTEFLAGEYWGEAIASGPLSDTLGARIALQYREMVDGYMKNLADPTTDVGSNQPVPAPADPNWPGEDQLLGRLTLKWTPIEAFDLNVKTSGTNLEQDGNTQNVEMFLCEALGRAQLDENEDCRADRRIRQNDVAPAVASTEAILNRHGGALFAHYDSQNVVATANYRLGDFVLTSVSGFTRYDTQYLGDYDLTGASVVFVAEDVDRNAFSEELRVLSNLDFPVNFLLGGYWQKTDLVFDQVARVAPVPVDPATGRYINWEKHSETDGQTFSAFGQLTWEVVDTFGLSGWATEALEVSPGVRFTHETKDSFSVHEYLNPASAAVFKPVGEPLLHNFSDDNLSPEVTIAWRPRIGSFADGMIFGAWKTGFKSGGYDNSAILRPTTTIANAGFKSERVSGFEGGIKSTWLDGALLLNLVGYTYEFEDLQIHFFDSADINFDVQNAASAKTEGFEGELRWLTPFEGLGLHGLVAYNEAPYVDFLSFCYAGQTYENGCNLDESGDPTPPPGTRQDLSGTVRPLAPRWAASFGLGYTRLLPELPLVGSVLVNAGADFGYTGRYLLNSLGRQVFQDAYFRSDAGLSFVSGNRSWELAFIGRNLSDEYVLFAGIDSPFTGGATGQPVTALADQIGVVNRPRELALQLTARF